MVGERITDWIEAMTPRGQQYVTLPQRIIYYRDGVSESQYDQVVLHELSTFGMAFNDVVTELANKKRVDPKASVTNPIIVAVVCGKRHHVRFYPLNAQSADRCDNCHPGTTVDDIVTSPYYQDFYLQSHAAMKGTARPAHYFVVRNDDNTSVANLRSFVSITTVTSIFNANAKLLDTRVMLHLRPCPRWCLVCISSILR